MLSLLYGDPRKYFMKRALIRSTYLVLDNFNLLSFNERHHLVVVSSPQSHTPVRQMCSLGMGRVIHSTGPHVL